MYVKKAKLPTGEQERGTKVRAQTDAGEKREKQGESERVGEIVGERVGVKVRERKSE